MPFMTFVLILHTSAEIQNVNIYVLVPFLPEIYIGGVVTLMENTLYCTFTQNKLIKHQLAETD